MAASRVNLAVTKDGETYNKLRRPSDFPLSAPPNSSPLTSAPSPASHTGKRKCDQDGASGSKRVKAERINTQRSTHGKGRPRTQDTVNEYAPRNVLPVLDEDEQLSDDENEVRAYLRGVRYEASAIPTLLVAPNSPQSANGRFDAEKKRTYTNAIDTQHAVYEEGTWVAVDHGYNATVGDCEADPGHLDPQESCHRTILQRFQNLRNKLTEFKENGFTPPPKPIRMPRSKRDWAETVEHGYPVIEEVLGLNDWNLYTAIQGCTLALSHSTTISRQKSCWIWTLLALTSDFGTLDNERISRIRDLSLGAAQLGSRLRRDVVASRHNEVHSPGVRELETEGVHAPDRHGEATSRGNKNARDDGATDSPKTALAELDDLPCPPVNGQENGDVTEEESSKSDTDMVMSESEGEADVDLEQARARLLAQLGDRLVQPGISLRDEPPVKGVHSLSRVEAERQRQEMRNAESHKKLAPHAAPITSAQNEAICKGKNKDKAPLTGIDWNTRAAIAMILTVVAECYGQRDLLEFREAW